MNIDTYKNKGLSGLANLGNTCFVNSCLQVLSHTYELNDFLKTDNFKSKLRNINDSVLLVEWDNLRDMLWSENCIISPNKFIGAVQKIAQIKKRELFTGFAQNDLPEFLLFLIDSFHNAIAREVNMNINGRALNDTDNLAVKCYGMIKKQYEKEYSEIWNMFYGVHVSNIYSLNGKQTLSVTPEPYFIIDLPLPPNNKSPSLIDCFNEYVKEEELSGENAWYNENTNEKQPVKKQILFWSLPNILTIDLKRFNEQNKKNQRDVTYPLENLDLSPYVVGYQKERCLYDLYGICNHSGNPLGGHYTAYIKNANGKWYHFNDTNVKEIKDKKDLQTNKAYCFFYRKKNLA